MEKLKLWALREARKDKQWAKKKIKDKQWMKMASTMSKEMLFERLNEPIEKLAKNKVDYLKLRSSAQGKVYGSPTWIDESARKQYKKITGKYPSIKLKKIKY